MPTALKIFTVFVFVLLILIAAPRIFEFVGRRQVPEMTPEKAQKLFETAGGVNEVNREAKIFFEQLGTNDWSFLYPQDLTNAPAISSLYSTLKNYSGSEYSGTRVAIWPEHGRHLEIRFGNHWVGKEIFVFDTNNTNGFDSPTSWYPITWFQISSNIFVSK
jgi:hypothetical protein